MKKFPRHLNTAFDYDFVREHFPVEKWLPVYEELIRDYHKWQKTAELESKIAGTEDVNNKIMEEQDEVTKETKFVQYEYKVDSNCIIKRLGMDITKIEKIVNEATK